MTSMNNSLFGSTQSNDTNNQEELNNKTNLLENYLVSSGSNLKPNELKNNRKDYFDKTGSFVNLMNESRQIFQSISSNSRSNIFQDVLYNIKEKNINKNLICPISSDFNIWKNAMINNPDKENLYPIHINGFKALENRVATQKIFLQICKVQLNKFKNELNSSLNNSNDYQKIKELNENQFDLSNRSAHAMIEKDNLDSLNGLNLSIESDINSRKERVEVIKDGCEKLVKKVKDYSEVIRKEKEFSDENKIENINLGLEESDLALFLETAKAQQKALKRVRESFEKNKRIVEIIEAELKKKNGN